MARWETFTFRVDKAERLMLEVLADQSQRTQSDVMRLLLHQAIDEILAQRDVTSTVVNDNANEGKHD